MEDKLMSIMADSLRKEIRESLDTRKDINDDEILTLITDKVFERAKQKTLSLIEKQALVSVIFNSIRKLDVLQPLIEDKEITEIMVNGANNIFAEKHGLVYKVVESFESRQKLEDVIQTIVSKVNRVVNEAAPIVDARLEDGSRVNVVLSPIALNGPILTIRKFPERPISMEDLISWNSITRDAAAALQQLVEAKYNIFICGGTGSGKTSFLNVLAAFIPSDERIVTIEDSAELQLTNISNLVRLETRNANTEGKGEITIRELIRASLRMRPERIIVGEVRGAEALDMLQAMNTGHDGSISTGHGNSTKDMLSRLETMVLSNSIMPLAAIRQQISSAVDIMIHLARFRDRSRRVVEITEITGFRDGEIQLNPLYTFAEEMSDDPDRVAGSLKRTGSKMQNVYKLKMAGINTSI